MKFLEVFKLILTMAGSLGLLSKPREYFDSPRRAKRAELFSSIASDVVAWVVLQAGATADFQTIFNECLAELKKALINEGESEASAAEKAGRLVAGALARHGVLPKK